MSKYKFIGVLCSVALALTVIAGFYLTKKTEKVVIGPPPNGILTTLELKPISKNMKIEMARVEKRLKPGKEDKISWESMKPGKVELLSGIYYYRLTKNKASRISTVAVSSDQKILHLK